MEEADTSANTAVDFGSAENEAVFWLEGRQLRLSKREVEVLEFVVAGKENTVIATIFGCAKRTVAAHVAKLFKVLAVETRMELVLAGRAMLGLDAGQDLRRAAEVAAAALERGGADVMRGALEQILAIAEDARKRGAG